MDDLFINYKEQSIADNIRNIVHGKEINVEQIKKESDNIKEKKQ